MLGKNEKGMKVLYYKKKSVKHKRKQKGGKEGQIKKTAIVIKFYL